MPGSDGIEPSDVIEKAIRRALAGDLEGAAIEVERIDPEERWAEKQRRRREVVAAAEASGIPTEVTKNQIGRNVPQAVRLAVFARDHYICRYVHCGRRTIDERVFAALARLIPDALPYHQNWGRQKAHPMVWTHLASFEHITPWSVGGDNSETNLVTTCSLCNYTKMNYLPEQLGWTLRAVPDESEPWDGLLSYRAELEALAPRPPARWEVGRAPTGTAPTASPSTRLPSTSTTVVASKLVVGDFVALRFDGNKTTLRYRVASTDDGRVGLVQMWRSGGRWAESPTVREIAPEDYPEVELLAHDGPVEGDLAED